jgi:hypothetical protein
LGDFSRLYPRPRERANFAADNREAAILRHFSVMPAGIKPYRELAIKTLSATPGSLNTDAGFRASYPRS